MKLPLAPDKYDRSQQTRVQVALEQEDGRNRKKGADLEIVNERLILHSPNGTRYKVVVSDLGALSAVAI